MRAASVSTLSLVLFASLAPHAVHAQAPHTHDIPDVPLSLLTRPIAHPLGIGSAHDAVSTRVPDAQAFYDQGCAYLHGYVWIDAARSFHQALTLDPQLAIAQAGLSLAYTELNKPDLARDALAAAERLAASANEHDRTHVTLRRLQAAAESAPGDPRPLATYRQALDAALVKFPGDAELWMLRGHAESTDPANRGQGSGASSVRFYDKALALGATAAHHYLAHAYENSGQTGPALTHAAAYARSAPAVPHALHMHGHELRRVGRVEDAIAAFEAADKAEREYLSREQLPPEYDWHNEHNLDLLGSSYWYVGRIGRAAEVLEHAFALPSALLVQMYNKRTWPDFLIARGRYDDAAAAGARLTTHSAALVRAVGYIAIGRAKLAKGEMAAAAADANRALAEMRASPGGQQLIAPAMAQLQGEFFLLSGQRERGRDVLRRVAADARALSGPDNWVQALFLLDAVARTARQAGDWEFARWAADQMIAHDPNYAGGHFALALAAEQAGDRTLARQEAQRAAALWQSADPGLPELARLSTLK